MVHGVVVKQDVFEGINPGIKVLDGVEVAVDDQGQQAPHQTRHAGPGRVQHPSGL
jgi:hypothetical protein